MRFPRLTSLVFGGMVLLAMMACALPFDNPLAEKPEVVAAFVLG